MNSRLISAALSLAYTATTNALMISMARCGLRGGQFALVHTDTGGYDLTDLQIIPFTNPVAFSAPTYLQMQCDSEEGYEILLWNSFEAADDYRYSNAYEEPFEKFKIPDFEFFKDGGCTQALGKELSSGITFAIDEGDNVTYPSCEVYDPTDYCPYATCFPHMKLLGLGFDITEDIDITNKRNQKQHIIRLEGPKVRIDSGSDSLFRSENTRYQPIDRSSQQGKTHSYTTSESFTTARSTKMNIKGTYGVRNVGSALKLSASEQYTFKQSKARSENVMQIGLGTVSFKTDDTDIFPTYQFWKAIVEMNEIFTYCEYDECYNYFVKYVIPKFGTHYVSSITVGGQVKFILETSACISENERSVAVEASLCAGVKTRELAREGCVDTHNNNDAAESISNSISSYDLEIIGPRAENICVIKSDRKGFECDFPKLVNATTLLGSGIIEYEVREILELIDLNFAVKGRFVSDNGRWAGIENYDFKAFYKRYIESKKEEDETESPCVKLPEESAAQFGAKFSLVELLVSLAVSMFMY